MQEKRFEQAAPEPVKLPHNLIVEDRRTLTATGVTRIVSYAIEPYTRWCAGYGLPDLRQSPEDWVCADTARYYGLASLSAGEARTYPFPGRANTALLTGEIAGGG